jgi:uncharacterized protein YndB with AHSA1/START domain
MIAIAVVVVIVGLFAFIATRPNSFHVERSAEVGAPAGAVFPLINDFHEWAQWSPWEKMDPTMKKTFEGPSAGPGAVYAWSGNNKVGEGRMTILESKPAERVVIKLQFFKPFAATNQATFTLAPAAAGTRVTWSMDGRNTLMGKVFSLFMDMDKMIGKDFEKGLANLNTAAQAVTQRQAASATTH